MPAKNSARTPRRGYASATRSEQARQTRKRVIAAATRLFVQRGYATTTVRAIAAAADVSVPTVELLFGTKALSRAWAAEAQSARHLTDFLSTVVQVLGEAQARSAGVMLAAYEAAASDPDIHVLIADRESQRERMASWIVDGVMARAAIRPGIDRSAAIDTVWMLMDPVVFSRLTRHRGWSADRYRSWFADSVTQLLTS